MEVFAVVPARGGSRRVPDKNVRDLGGKPLIAHAIDQARSAETIDRTVVSTDDPDIASVAREYGGEVPFRRPAKLATDEASSPPVIEHALEWARDEGLSPDIVVMLQVTTPLRTAEDVDRAIRTLRDHEEATSVISVTKFDTPPQWALERTDDGFLDAHFEADVLWTDDVPRSQDLPDLYYPNGAIFAALTDRFLDRSSFYTAATLPYEMPPERSIDVDEEYELDLARALYESE